MQIMTFCLEIKQRAFLVVKIFLSVPHGCTNKYESSSKYIQLSQKMRLTSCKLDKIAFNDHGIFVRKIG